MAGVDVMIVTDAQVHIWPPETPDRPWLPGGRSFAHADSLPVDHLLGQMDTARVDAAVLVPPSFEGDRNDACLAAAAAHPDRFRVMGRITVTDPATAELLPGWRAQPGMLGLRVTFANGPAIAWLTDGTADWVWPAAEAAGLPVMVFAPGNLATIGRIAAEHPGLRLVVDHLGIGTKLRDAAIDPVIDEVIGLARHDNIAVKATCLPGNVTEAYPFPSLHDRIHRVLDAFGPRRVFWGSDLSRLPSSYDEVRRLFTDELDFLSGDDLAWVMGRGVRTWLGWTG
jgi:predicted TIM-barrel fold metal-dependent hydrolase